MTNGALLNQMRGELIFNVAQGGFETEIIVTDKSAKTETVKGVATLHSLTFDPEQGVPMTGTNAHCCISTDELINAGFNLYTDTKHPKTINMKDWIIYFDDNDGITHKFRVKDARPSKTTGVIVIFLADLA